MIGDHHGQSAGQATLLVRALDAILGTHTHEQQVFTLSDGIGRGAPDPVPAMVKRYRPLV
jgi:hypothetical protein